MPSMFLGSLLASLLRRFFSRSTRTGTSIWNTSGTMAISRICLSSSSAPLLDKGTNSPSDAELIERCLRKDNAAWEMGIARFRRRVFHIAYKFTGKHDEAEDLTQEIFVKMYRSIGTFNGKSKFSTWLYTIARNICIDHQRKMKFRAHASLEAAQPGKNQALGDRLANPGPSTERLAAGGLLKERIAAAVEALPLEQREVFLLRQLQGLAFNEIAGVVGAPANTVKSRMRYALERLQEVLRDLEEPDEV